MRRRSTKTRKPVIRNTQKKQVTTSNVFFKILIVLVFILTLLGIGNLYRDDIAGYFGYTPYKLSKLEEYKPTVSNSDMRVYERAKNNLLGIDVSEYQGDINWKKAQFLEGKYLFHFVFMRATVGNDRIDKNFEENWRETKKNRLIRGAYHYYRPDENSLDQARLFIKTVTLEKGDLPPVLDIEKLAENQTFAQLKLGLKRWLNTVEKHYKVKPIIYTSEKYYKDFLKRDFGNYYFWIANYNFSREEIDEDWLFWQFTEKARVEGIKGRVDADIYSGNLQQLRNITIEN